MLMKGLETMGDEDDEDGTGPIMSKRCTDVPVFDGSAPEDATPITETTPLTEQRENSARLTQVLHGIAVPSTNRRPSSILKEAVPDDKLVGCWGDRGCWMVCGSCPKVKEKAFSERSHTKYPTNCFEDVQMFDSLAALTSKGQKSKMDTTVGQDNMSIACLPNGWELFCIADGHGPGGHWPATRTVQTMPYFFSTDACENELLAGGSEKAAIERVFALVQLDLELASIRDGVSLEACGCTASCLLRNDKRYPGRFWVGTVGDSRCILFGPRIGLKSETDDHKPLRPDEKSRIEANRGDIRVTDHPGGFQEVRIYVKGENYPGLCMSRSMGDQIIKEYGVIAVPEVVEWKVPEGETAHVLLATDGVWEFLESADVVKLLLTAIPMGPRKSLEVLLAESRHRWKQNEGLYCDDITMILLHVSGDQATGLELLTSVLGNQPACGGSCNSKCSIL